MLHTDTKDVYIQCNTRIHMYIYTLILAESVRNMVSRSIPMPQPPVGGSPYSSAVQKFSSTACACGRERPPHTPLSTDMQEIEKKTDVYIPGFCPGIALSP